ncbi:hypothetical protein OROMI_031754 [Orobanche minor]
MPSHPVSVCELVSFSAVVAQWNTIGADEAFSKNGATLKPFSSLLEKVNLFNIQLNPISPQSLIPPQPPPYYTGDHFNLTTNNLYLTHLDFPIRTLPFKLQLNRLLSPQTQRLHSYLCRGPTTPSYMI